MSSAESIRSHQGHLQAAQNVRSLLNWDDPIRTSTVLAECLVLLAIFQNGGVFRFILRMGYLAIGVTAFTEFATKFLSGGQSGLVSSFRPSRMIFVNKEHLQIHGDMIASVGVEVLYWVRRVIDARDLKLTAVSFVAIWFLYILTAIVPFSMMLTIAVILAFLLPPIYSRFTAELDHAHAYFSSILSNKYSEYHNHVATAVDPHLQTYRSARDTMGTVFGTNRSMPPDAAPPPPMAPPSMRAPSVRAPSIKAQSIKAGSIKSQGGFNPAMAVGAGALGGAALGAGAMAMGGGGGSAGGSAYSGEYSDYGSYDDEEYSQYTGSIHH